MTPTQTISLSFSGKSLQIFAEICMTLDTPPKKSENFPDPPCQLCQVPILGIFFGFSVPKNNHNRVLASCGMYSGVATLKLSGASKEKAEPRSMKRTWGRFGSWKNQPSRRNERIPNPMIRFNMDTWIHPPKNGPGALELMYAEKNMGDFFSVFNGSISKRTDDVLW